MQCNLPLKKKKYPEKASNKCAHCSYACEIKTLKCMLEQLGKVMGENKINYNIMSIS